LRSSHLVVVALWEGVPVPTDLGLVLAVAGVAAIASPVGGAVALWRRPTSIVMSLALGFAGGVLLATISFEMMPQA
jgi:zinc transporter, ZIP family